MCRLDGVVGARRAVSAAPRAPDAPSRRTPARQMRRLGSTQRARRAVSAGGGAPDAPSRPGRRDRMTPVTAQILDGNATLKTIKADLKERVAKLKEQGVVPGLGTVLVGNDPGSTWYVNGKHKDCAEVGITSIRVDLPDTATQAEVEAHIAQLNADPACTGYIVQLPLPKHMVENEILGQIDPAKDVDGLHPT